MKTVYIIKSKNSDGYEQILDICTNKKSGYQTVLSLTKANDSIIFNENVLFQTMQKYKFNYSNFVSFTNKLPNKKSFSIDIYRMIDEFEKIFLITIVVQKWHINSK